MKSQPRSPGFKSDPSVRLGVRLGPALTIMGTLVASIAMSDETTYPLLANTMLFATTSTLISLPIGALLAIGLFRTNLGWRRRLVWTLTLLLFLPAYLQIAGWDAALGLQGWATRSIFPTSTIAPLYGWRGAILVQTILNIPWTALFVASSLANTSSHLEELASLDGDAWQVLWHVTRRRLAPALLATGLFVWVMTASDITVTDVFQIRTFAEEMYTGFVLGETLPEVLRRSASGLILTIGLALAALFPLSQLRKELADVRIRTAWRADLGSHRQFARFAIAVLLFVLLAVPLASLLYQAGLIVASLDGQRVRSWSLAKSLRFVILSPGHFREEYAWSFLLAQLTSVTAILLAMIGSWFGLRYRAVRIVFRLAAMIALALPGPVVSLALSKIFSESRSDLLFYLYDRTLLVAWISLSVRLFPFAYVMTDLHLAGKDRRWFELASVTGASSWRVFGHTVLLPYRDFFLWQWIVMMAIAIGDLSSTILATPPGVTTVAIRIFNLVHYGVADQLAGLCLASVLLFGLLTAAVIAFFPTPAPIDSRTV